jgi:hypothetical protein
LSFVRNSNSKKTRRFWKPSLFRSSGDRRDTPTLLGPLERAKSLYLALSKGPKRMSPSPHLRTETDPVSRNVVFSCIYNSRTMDKLRKRNTSEFCTPSSEPFRFYLKKLTLCHSTNRVTDKLGKLNISESIMMLEHVRREGGSYCSVYGSMRGPVCYRHTEPRIC